jgi:hypothetical protein
MQSGAGAGGGGGSSRTHHLIRTNVLEALIAEEKQRQLAMPAFRPDTETERSNGNNNNGGGDVCSVVAFVRAHPALSNPSWAMEELGRINNNPATWERSMLPLKVWCSPIAAASLGAVNGPFGTLAEDAVQF